MSKEKPQTSAEEQQLLDRITSSVSAAMSAEEIKRLVIGVSLDSIRAERGYVTLLPQQQRDDGSTTSTRSYDRPGDALPRHLRMVLAGFMGRHQEPLLVNEAVTDERFKGCEWCQMPIRSVLAVPLTVKARLVGYLALFNKKTGGFTRQDQKHLYLVGELSAETLVLAQLRTDYLKDLEAARIIQQTLLPKETPKIRGFDVAGMMVPSKMVGGDYFDYPLLSDGRLGFVVADVSGKGLPAAMLMCSLQATVRSQAAASSSCLECLNNINRMLINLPMPTGDYVTLFLAVLDAGQKTLCYSNAGHNPPLLFRADGIFQRLTTGGRFLGVAGLSDEAPYDEARVSLSKGDLLLIFSDGVIEARNKKDEQFGENRLLEAVKPILTQAASDILSGINKAVHDFTGERSAADDLTLMVVKAS